MTDYRSGLRRGLENGFWKGLRGFLWITKILLPISFLTALLQWSGWLAHVEFLLRPLTRLLSLPAIAAVPIVIGMVTNIYGGIAAMVVLPFSREQMTLIAIFLLIAHNLIQEGVVQAKSGIHPVKATVFRLVAGVITVMVVALFVPSDSVPVEAAAVGLAQTSQSFAAMLLNWTLMTLRLLLKIFGIVMLILTTLEVFKELNWIDPIVRALRPALRGLGLSDRVGILWMTAVVFGLAYGAAVIVEEAGRGDLSRDELEQLHLSIGINHSMVEDPMLFVALGLNPFWLWIPRLIMAILAVRLLSFWTRFRQSRINAVTE